MPTQKKIETVKKLTQNLAEAKSFVLAAYEGLKTSEIDGLKKEVEAKGSKFLVVKNTLTSLALEQRGIELPSEVLNGSTAILLNSQPGLEGLKALTKFAKSLGREVLKIKLGFFDGRVFNGAETLTMASLPGREVLLSQFLGLMNSPLTNFVAVLKADQRKLAVMLNEVAKKKSA